MTAPVGSPVRVAERAVIGGMQQSMGISTAFWLIAEAGKLIGAQEKVNSKERL
jgi:hypothetical protein